VDGNVWVYKPTGWTNPTGGNLPPAVQLTAPEDGTALPAGSVVTLKASASDADGFVTAVEFLVNGTKIGEASSAPYQSAWTAGPAGKVTLTAVAMDEAGARTTSSPVTVDVVAANAPPQVTLTQPAAGATFTTGTAISLVADAADSDGTVARVEFFDGTSKIGESLAAPFSMSWSGATAGSHTLKARAIDDKGAATVSATVGITVVEPSQGGATVVLQRGSAAGGVGETYLSSYHPTLAFGTAQNFLDHAAYYSTLLRFSIFLSEGGPIPDGAPIRSAVLSVYKYSGYDMTYGLHRMLKDWAEGTATWNQRGGGQPWAAPGANGVGTDFTQLPDATAATPFNAGWVSFDVTAAVQQMSQQAPNHGWRLRGSAGSTTALKRFHSSEYTSDSALRPKLVIVHE
jgi:hypothetical protein